MIVEIGEELWNTAAIARIIPYANSQWVVVLIWGEKVVLPYSKGRLLKHEVLKSQGVAADTDFKEPGQSARDFWGEYCDEHKRLGEFRV